MKLSGALALAWATLLLPGTSDAKDTFTTLYAFTGGADGANPMGSIARDRAGNIYGVTGSGGAFKTGTVFELSPPAQGQTSWTETTLADLDGRKTGRDPRGGIIRDRKGQLFGAMARGGQYNCGTVYTVHKSRTGWKAETLWDFGATAGDGCTIWATLAIGANGVLFGTTLTGGAASYGTVFSLTPPAPGSTQWTETVIWSFDGTIGNEPQAGVLIDSAGNLYGTCLGDSTYSNMLVWMLTPPGTQGNAWTLHPLYTTPPHSAIEPTTSALVADASGNLFGTTFIFATVYELSPPALGSTAWTATVIAMQNKGAFESGLTLGPKGQLVWSQARPGSIDLLSPYGGTTWTRKTLWKSTNRHDQPQAPVILGPDGAIYGIDSGAGKTDAGAVWMLAP